MVAKMFDKTRIESTTIKSGMEISESHEEGKAGGGDGCTQKRPRAEIKFIP